MPAYSLGDKGAWALTTHTDQQVSGSKEFLGTTTLRGESIFAGPVDFSPTNLFPTQYEPAATNYVINPSFEGTTAGWDLTTGATIALDGIAGNGYTHGVQSGKVTIASTGNVWTAASPSVASRPAAAAGEVWTFSVHIRGTVGKKVDIGIGGYLSDGNNINSGNVLTYTLTGSFTRVSVTGIMPAGTVKVGTFIRNQGGIDQGTYDFNIDGVQLEKNPVRTSYLDGSMGAGYAWTGAANASTSTRAGTTIAVAARDIATTNLLTNPSFNGNIGGWTNGRGGTNISVSYNPNEGRIGRGCLEVLATTVGGGEVLRRALSPSAPASPGQVISFSAWVKGQPGKKVVMDLLYYNSSGGLLGGSGSVSATQGFILTGEWQRIGSQGGAAYAGTASVQLEIGPDNLASMGQWVLADGVQIEVAAAPTSYVDGSLGEGYAWTGTPHASTSTRAANTVIPAIVKSPVPHGMVSENNGRNMVYNPRADIDTSAITLYRSTVTRITGSTPVGASAFRLSISASGAVRSSGLHFETAVPTAVVGETYTASAWVRSVVGTSGVVIDLNISGQGSQNSVIVTSHSWTRVSATIRATTAGNLTFYVLNGATMGATAEVFDVCGAQLEVGGAPSTYIEGSLGSGYYWEGTPHASPSRRTVGTKVLSSDGPASTALRGAMALGTTNNSVNTGTAGMVPMQTVLLNPSYAKGDGVYLKIPPGQGGVYAIDAIIQFVTGGTSNDYMEASISSTNISLLIRGGQYTPNTRYKYTMSGIQYLPEGTELGLTLYQTTGSVVTLEGANSRLALYYLGGS